MLKKCNSITGSTKTHTFQKFLFSVRKFSFFCFLLDKMGVFGSRTIFYSIQYYICVITLNRYVHTFQTLSKIFHVITFYKNFRKTFKTRMYSVLNKSDHISVLKYTTHMLLAKIKTFAKEFSDFKYFINNSYVLRDFFEGPRSKE